MVDPRNAVMERRRFLAAFAAAPVAGCLPPRSSAVPVRVLPAAAEPEPTYLGRTLGEWIAAACGRKDAGPRPADHIQPEPVQWTTP